MQTTLRRVGNTVALFIGKPLQQLLDLEAGSVVRLQTDGTRLVIEPTGDAAPRRVARLEPWRKLEYMEWAGARNEEDSRASYFALATINELIDEDIPAETFLRLFQHGAHTGCWYPPKRMHIWLELYRSRLFQPQPRLLTEPDFATMRRLEALLRHVRAGSQWNDAEQAALLEAPLVPVPVKAAADSP